MKGRILYYNPQTGLGKLILESEERLEFSADIWSDFDAIPKPGSVVACEIESGVLKSIKSFSNTRKDDLANTKVTIFDDEQKAQVEQTSHQREMDCKIHATFSVNETIKSYFKPLDVLIGRPPQTLDTSKQLNYFLIKRFLFTAYNDLKGLDASIHNNEGVRKKLEDIQEFQKAYYTVSERLNTPKLAFEIIFLRSQPEYLRFIKHKEQCLSRISILSHMEVSLFPDLQRKEEELKTLSDDDNKTRQKLEKELKTMRGYYVDTIHENASLTEELSNMDDLRELYSDIYMQPFILELLKRGGQYQEMLLRILNYRAYDFDKMIWHQAEQSKMIQEFFSTSSIEGDYSTLTFLKYYLQTLDQTKINEEQKDLFELLEYLEEQKK